MLSVFRLNQVVAPHLDPQPHNLMVRKIIKTRGHFPSDEAATKLIWLALRNITAAWSLYQRRIFLSRATFITSFSHSLL